MNNIHDCGGMQNLGPLNIEKDEPVFHEQWEKDVFTSSIHILYGGLDSVDAFRYEIEKMHPVAYLQTEYYEHWLHAIEQMAYRAGVLTPEEVTERMKALS